MARKYTFAVNKGEKDANINVGDVVDANAVKCITGVDPDDEEADLIQNHRPQDFLGRTPLYDTFYRSSKYVPYKYCGLCEKGQHVNRHPECAEKVFICSPYRGNGASETAFNTMLTVSACRKAYNNGRIPVAPHLYFTNFMKDEDFERDYGITAGHELMKQCSRIVVYVVDGYISEGMNSDIEFATMRLALAPKFIHMTKEEAEEFIEQYVSEV